MRIRTIPNGWRSSRRLSTAACGWRNKMTVPRWSSELKLCVGKISSATFAISEQDRWDNEQNSPGREPDHWMKLSEGCTPWFSRLRSTRPSIVICLGPPDSGRSFWRWTRISQRQPASKCVLLADTAHRQLPMAAAWHSRPATERECLRLSSAATAMAAGRGSGPVVALPRAPGLLGCHCHPHQRHAARTVTMSRP